MGWDYKVQPSPGLVPGGLVACYPGARGRLGAVAGSKAAVGGFGLSSDLVWLSGSGSGPARLLLGARAGMFGRRSGNTQVCGPRFGSVRTHLEHAVKEEVPQAMVLVAVYHGMGKARSCEKNPWSDFSYSLPAWFCVSEGAFRKQREHREQP